MQLDTYTLDEYKQWAHVLLKDDISVKIGGVKWYIQSITFGAKYDVRVDLVSQHEGVIDYEGD